MMKYFSMFSGIGGFEKGIEQSGVDMECVGYSEIDKYAVSIYERWFPNHINWGDATEIDPKELPDFDFLVGGFPCQAFSLAGKRKGFDDTRGTLFFEIARVLREKRPRYFLLENVKGLLSHDRGKTFQKILGVLAELGYDVEWEVLNSKWFVPQNRERIFLKGYFRAKCGGEILSQKRDSREIIGEVNSNNKLIQINNNKPHSMAERIYDSDGLSTTLRGCGGGQGGKTGLYKVGNCNPSGHGQSGNVYDPNGLSTTICADGKTGLYKVELLNGTVDGNIGCLDANYHKGLSPSDIKQKRQKRTHIIESKDDPEIKKVGNVAANGTHCKGNVYSDESISPSVLACNYKDNIKVLESESKIKKCYGSTQKHRAETDGSYPPTLTSAMGEGGGHVPMVETEEKPLKIRTDVEKGYVEDDINDGVRLDHPNSNTRRGTVQKESTGALSCGSDWGTVDKDFRIRRLTPKECERLQGFPDDWTKYGKDGELISDTQRYKCCGNAVTVNVIEFLIRSMFG